MTAGLKKKLKTAGMLITPYLEAALTDPNRSFIDPKDQAQKDLLVRLLSKRDEGYRAGAFHPSSVTSCMRSQVFGFLGVPPKRVISPGLQNIFNDGTWRHARWQITLLSAGILTAVEVPIDYPPLRISGSLDGINDQREFDLEFKGINQWQYESIKSEPRPEHIIQKHAYWLYGPYDWHIGSLIYENKGTSQYHEHIVRWDQKIADVVHKVVEELNEHVNDETLPPVLAECKAEEGETWKGCPYAYVCKRVKTYDQGEELSLASDWTVAEKVAHGYGPTVTKFKIRSRNP